MSLMLVEGLPSREFTVGENPSYATNGTVMGTEDCTVAEGLATAATPATVSTSNGTLFRQAVSGRETAPETWSGDDHRLRCQDMHPPPISLAKSRSRRGRRSATKCSTRWERLGILSFASSAAEREPARIAGRGTGCNRGDLSLERLRRLGCGQWGFAGCVVVRRVGVRLGRRSCEWSSVRGSCGPSPSLHAIMNQSLNKNTRKSVRL